MKNLQINNSRFAKGFLCLAFFCFGLVGVSAQETETKPALPQAPRPAISPTPSASPTPVPIQNTADLPARIRLSLSRPELRRGQVGVKIISLDTNRTIFEENAEKYFVPASNMKSYTVAAAMEKLSPDFRFVTSVYAPAQPDASGAIRGDLTIFGRGDISFSSAFYGDLNKSIDALAEKIAQAGVKRIEGNLIGDESYFSGNPFALTWEWNDLQWYYGAEVSALSVNDNMVNLTVRPGAEGAPCGVQLLPANMILRIVNQCTTSAKNMTRELRVEKKLDQNILEIRGTMPVGDQNFQGRISVSRPAALFVEFLRGRLAQKGIIVTGQNKIVSAKDKENSPPNTSIEIARLESMPFSVIAAKTMKPSQNLYTETILWTLGEEIGRKQEAVLATGNEAAVVKLRNTTSAELGIKVVQNFMQEIGVASDSLIQWDGSGLSRRNLVTPASTVSLYAFMAKSRYANVWRDSLTIGATDGTLQNRFRGTAAAANARGKTGTINQVSSLAGYVTTASGERLVFAIFVNGVSDTQIRQSVIDEIVVTLANSGR